MQQTFRLDGRVALVTGASRGIGRAIALELGRAGARIGVHYRTGRDEAAEVVAAIESGNVIARRAAPDEAPGDVGASGSGAGGVASQPPHLTGASAFERVISAPRAASFQCDLENPAAASRLVDACTQALGPVEILVNNAGIWNGMPIDDFDEDRLEQMLNLNLKAIFRVTAAAAPGMKARGWGRIVGISSTAALLGEPEHAHYAASKGALEAFTRSLAVELGPAGITANTVAPGWTLTQMVESELSANPQLRTIAAEIPTRRLASPEDVAFAVRFLVSPEARQVNGICLPVEGGYRWRR